MGTAASIALPVTSAWQRELAVLLEILEEVVADMISGDTTTCDVEALYLRRLRGHQPHLQIARRQRP